MKRSKSYNAALEKFDRDALHTPLEAVRLAKETSTTKFAGTVEVALRLGVDPRKADQMVRGTVMLPHGTGKTARVLVFAGGAKADEARAAGADYVGTDDMIEKVAGGWTDFDSVVSTPDLMGKVGRLGKVLGPRGLMPNPKTGTVTDDTAKAVKEVKAGRVEFKIDKAGNVHVPVGKVSFTPQQLAENAHAVIEAVLKAKPSSVKGTYMASCTLSATMSPPVRVDLKEFTTH